MDAASELFLERSYAHTSIEQITTRAGVSRASFFNYFGAKSDLLWGDLDSLVDAVAGRLAEQPADVEPMEGVRQALIAAAGSVGADRIPLAITQCDLIGAGDELLTSGFRRFVRLAGHVEHYLDLARSGDFPARAAAFAVVGALAAAAGEWAASGTRRGPLAPVIDAAVTPVCRGYGGSS